MQKNQNIEYLEKNKKSFVAIFVPYRFVENFSCWV